MDGRFGRTNRGVVFCTSQVVLFVVLVVPSSGRMKRKWIWLKVVSMRVCSRGGTHRTDYGALQHGKARRRAYLNARKVH